MNYIGISNDNLEKVAKKLNELLSSYSVYYQNLRSFHWHVKGRDFFDIHELFESLYNDAKLKIDEIAERILTINHKPLGSMTDYLVDSSIKEAKDVLPAEEMAKVILTNHKILISQMREVLEIAGEVKDEGTVDVVSGFLSHLEKESWILNAWTERKGSKA